MASLPKLETGALLSVGTHEVRILNFFSEGGFAQIYKVNVEPKVEDSEIACLKRVILKDKYGLSQMRKEVEVMKSLRNARSIVRYYDSNAERLENGTYQVLVLMELCPNNSLLDYMNTKISTKLTENEVLKVLFDICIGVYEMHKCGMIHRDIKIENVLIDAKSRFKLCDFGSTSSPIMPPKDSNEFRILSHDLLYQTTPQYRSPDMIDLYRGFPIDEKADIWALGCFLYKLCYFTTPFEASGDIAILHASFQFLPTPVFSDDLKNLILIMLQESPYWRPNIVQILMLLSSMLKIPFRDIGVEDFYMLGPYNFQALHEYQTQRKKELMNWQQLYFQQFQYARSYIANSQHATSAKLINNNEKTEDLPDSSLLLPTRSKSQGSKSEEDEYIVKETSNEYISDQESEAKDRFSLEDDYSDELGELENVEERYPSLDIIGIRDAGNQELIDKTKIGGQLAQNLSELNKEDSRRVGKRSSNNTGLQTSSLVSQKSFSELHSDYARDAEMAAVDIEDSNLNAQEITKSHSTGSHLNKKEAWMGQASRIDKSAEKLADDIFYASSKPNDNTTSAYEDTNGSKADKLNNDSNTKKYSESQEKSNSKKNELQKDTVFESNGMSSKFNVNDYPISSIDAMNVPTDSKSSNAASNVQNYDLAYTHKPNDFSVESRTKEDLESNNHTSHYSTGYNNTNNPVLVDGRNTENSAYFNTKTAGANPWASYTRNPQGVDKDANVNSNKLSRTTLKNKNAQRLLPESLAKLTINNSILYNSNDVLKDPDLIDLEVGANSINAFKNISNESTQSINELQTEESLIDLDTIKKLQEIHPKKRIPSTHNPAHLDFREEVIDFESDDEDPHHNSEMNRISIRDSLKKSKSRKSGEYKRTEHRRSDTPERKKRIGFFGTSSQKS